MEGQNVIIIKKVKKGGNGGSHGGSWKVAYADFVTAMMAFFLLLWLISMVAPEKRARVAHYFKHFSVFDKSGSTMLESNKAPASGLMIGEDSNEEPGGPAEPNDNPSDAEVTTPEKQLKQEIEKQLAEVMADRKDQVMVDTFDGGVRIELIDGEGAPMFPRGGSELTPDGKRVIRVISESLISRQQNRSGRAHRCAWLCSEAIQQLGAFHREGLCCEERTGAQRTGSRPPAESSRFRCNRTPDRRRSL